MTQETLKGAQGKQTRSTRQGASASLLIDGALSPVVNKENGAVKTVPGNEGRIVRHNVKGGLQVFAIYFWHSEDGRSATKHESCETADKANAVSMAGSL